jgi:hypothetical protein
LPSIRLNFTSLFELLAAQLDRLDAPHVGNVVERIFLQHEQVGGLALGQRAEFFVDAQGLRGALREGLDHLFTEMTRQVLKDGTALKADHAVFLDRLPKVGTVIGKLLG